MPPAFFFDPRGLLAFFELALVAAFDFFDAAPLALLVDLRFGACAGKMGGRGEFRARERAGTTHHSCSRSNSR